MTHKKIIASLVILAVASLLLTTITRSGRVEAAAPIVIKFSHVVAENTPKGQAALEFKHLVEKRTRGKVRVEVYPEASLYKDKEELEALQLGAVQMLAPSLAKFGQLGMRDFEVFDLPYIFPNKNVLRAVTGGEIGQTLLAQLEDKGILGLAYWDNGFKVFSANRPIKQPSDMRGLRLRIQPSHVLEAQALELGATPIPMAFSDVYNALDTGLVDGTENPPSNLFSKNMHKVQSNVTVTNHGYLGYAVIVNRKFWQSLPADLRDTLEKCIQDATLKNNAEAEKLNDQAMELVKQDGKTQVYELDEKGLKEWKKALIPVQRKMEGRISSNLIEKIRQVARSYPDS